MVLLPRLELGAPRVEPQRSVTDSGDANDSNRRSARGTFGFGFVAVGVFLFLSPSAKSPVPRGDGKLTVTNLRWLSTIEVGAQRSGNFSRWGLA